jgi:hypothetical protein
MAVKSALAALNSGCLLFISLTILIFACESNQVDSEALNASVDELSAESAHALPPVTGDPAFVWSPDDSALQWGPCPDFFPEGCELAVIQGDPADLNADVLLRLPPNSTADHHWHTSRERMVLLAGEMEVDYDGQDPVTLEKGRGHLVWDSNNKKYIDAFSGISVNNIGHCHPKVVEVPDKAPRERGVLRLYGEVPMATTPRGDRLKRPS